MRICLDLIKENQRVFLLSHSLAGDGTDLEIEVLDGADLLKQPWTVIILRKVQLDIVLKELLPDVADDKLCWSLTSSSFRYTAEFSDIT